MVKYKLNMVALMQARVIKRPPKPVCKILSTTLSSSSFRLYTDTLKKVIFYCKCAFALLFSLLALIVSKDKASGNYISQYKILVLREQVVTGLLLILFYYFFFYFLRQWPVLTQRPNGSLRRPCPDIPDGYTKDSGLPLVLPLYFLWKARQCVYYSLVS